MRQAAQSSIENFRPHPYSREVVILRSLLPTYLLSRLIETVDCQLFGNTGVLPNISGSIYDLLNELATSPWDCIYGQPQRQVLRVKERTNITVGDSRVNVKFYVLSLALIVAPIRDVYVILGSDQAIWFTKIGQGLSGPLDPLALEARRRSSTSFFPYYPPNDHS